MEEELEFNIFSDDEDIEQGITDDSTEQEQEKEKNIQTTEIIPNKLFSDEEEEEESESVSDDEDSIIQDEEDPTLKEKSGFSPKNTYSSIAAALKEDGILLNLEEKDIDSIKDANDFAEIIEKEVTKRLDDSQRRIKEALDYGVEPEEINKYKKTIEYLENITEDYISEENEQSELLRKQLIFQDFLNKGFSQERAKKQVEKSIAAGTDIEDAIEALSSNKEFYLKQYDDIIETNKKIIEDEKIAIQKQTEELRKKILETESPFEGIKLDKNKRIKILESLTKVVHKTKDGRGLNTIQKYELDNPVEYKQRLAVLFELTDGFKNLDVLIKGKVNKETRKSLQELEHKLKNTPTYNDGRLRLANATNDTNAYQGLKLDI